MQTVPSRLTNMDGFDHHNHLRPQGALGNQSPFEFARLTTRLVPSWGQRQHHQILSLEVVPFKGAGHYCYWTVYCAD